VKDNKGTMTGDLTMHGVTKPVTLAVEVGGIGKMGQGTIAGFTASGKIDRKDYGLTWNKTLGPGRHDARRRRHARDHGRGEDPPAAQAAETAATGK
jgi:polyisoprenoid-binding protein YceI